MPIEMTKLAVSKKITKGSRSSGNIRTPEDLLARTGALAMDFGKKQVPAAAIKHSAQKVGKM